MRSERFERRVGRIISVIFAVIALGLVLAFLGLLLRGGGQPFAVGMAIAGTGIVSAVVLMAVVTLAEEWSR